jgi:hypothetical protein
MKTENLIRKLFTLTEHYNHLKSKDELTIKENEALIYMEQVLEILLECEGHYDSILNQCNLSFEVKDPKEEVKSQVFDTAVGAVAGMVAGGVLDLAQEDKEEVLPSSTQEVCPVDKFLNPASMDDVYIDEEELAAYAELLL